MSYYAAPFTFDFAQSRVRIDSGVTQVDVGVLYDALKEAQASEEGILYGQIGAGSGLADLGDGVRVGLTVELLASWQVEFSAGAYIAKISGGNLVGGLSGDPIAYSAGVQVLLIQSAASTVVEVTAGSGGGGLTNDQAAQLLALAKIHGLVHGTQLVVGPNTRVAGDVQQSVVEAGGVVTISRL